MCLSCFTYVTVISAKTANQAIRAVLTEVSLLCAYPHFLCDSLCVERRSANQGSASSKQTSQSTAEADDAQRRFGNAKSISSSMFDEDTNKANNYEKQAMLSKFSVSQPALMHIPVDMKEWLCAMGHCCTVSQLTSSLHLRQMLLCKVTCN